MRDSVIRLHTEELVCDIAGKLALLAGAARGKDTDTEVDTHTVEDVLDDGNRELLENMVCRLVYEVMNLLYPFARTPQRGGVVDNKAHGVERYEIWLSFPYERSETQVRELCATAHEYIVDKCVAEWLSLTWPDSNWQEWEEKAQIQRERISAVLVVPLRPRRLRVTPHPY